MSPFIEKKSIAFDFDGVVADTMGFFVELVRNEYGRTDISLDMITDYDLRKCLDISTEILLEIGEKIISENCADYLKPIDGAVDVLNEYMEDSEHLCIITARPEKKPVEIWVEKYLNACGKDFTVVATGDFNSKSEVLSELGKKYLVEDRIETCFYLNEKGFDPIVFVQPWNRLPNDFIEVNSWNEISSMLLK
ncbi:MAG: haloacid dehalogenase [Deltaproteobacteria bacterium]|nr:MAG: haloacid dehalogenase [Deltaproteobacteria bacterium]